MSSIQGSAVMLKRDLATLGLECAGACTGGDPGMQHSPSSVTNLEV